MKSRQYTIRSVPAAIDRALRKRARDEQKSLNTVLLEALERSVQSAQEPKVYHDMDFAFGSWVDDPEFDAAIKEFDHIDWEMWK